MSEWQPIETAPRDGTMILLLGGEPDGHYDTHRAEPVPPMVVAWWESGEYVEDGWRFASYDDGIYGTWYEPKAWRPLPAPPTDRSNGG